jgi:hypothetical protein
MGEIDGHCGKEARQKAEPANKLLGAATESRLRCLGSPIAFSKDLRLMATLSTRLSPI